MAFKKLLQYFILISKPPFTKHQMINERHLISSTISSPAAVVLAEPILPYALAFAAGAMIFVVVDDIVPEAQAW